MLAAFKDFGIAFPNPLPAVTLESGFQLTLRGTHKLDMVVSYLGYRTFATRELLHIQRFHRAVLCWESGCHSEEFVPQSSVISPKEWTQSSNGACYFIFPLCAEDAMKTLAPKDPDSQYAPPDQWEAFLEKAASEAQCLIRKIRRHNTDSITQIILRKYDYPEACLYR